MAPKRILSLYDGFFLGGARIAHTEILCNLQTHSPQYHSVLGLTDRVVRESTLQLAADTIPYRRLQEALVPIAALPRDGSHPLTPDQTAQCEKALNNADVILSLKEQPLATLADIEVNKPLYVSIHRSDPETQGEGTNVLKELSESGRLTKAICCSEASREAYAAYGVREEHLIVVPNGISLERFYQDALLREQTRGLMQLPHDVPVVLLAARFDPFKNIGYFLEVALEFLQKEGQAHFLLCGTGMTQENPDFDELLRTVVPEDLLDRFHALGPQSDMNALYNVADLVAMTSTTEAAPLVLLEGMAAGAIPVTTAVGDAKLMVRDESLIIPLDDAKEAGKIWRKAWKKRYEHQASILSFREELGDQAMFAAYERILTGEKR